jgi:hypothetical protein
MVPAVIKGHHLPTSVTPYAQTEPMDYGAAHGRPHRRHRAAPSLECLTSMSQRLRVGTRHRGRDPRLDSLPLIIVQILLGERRIDGATEAVCAQRLADVTFENRAEVADHALPWPPVHTATLDQLRRQPLLMGWRPGSESIGSNGAALEPYVHGGPDGAGRGRVDGMRHAPCPADERHAVVLE